MDKVYKKPYEKFSITINFAQDLDSGEAVSAFTIACENAATGVDSQTSIIDNSSLQSPTALIVLKGGVDGEIHRLTVKASTTFDNIFEKELFIEVKDAVNARFSKRANEEFTVSYSFANCLEEGDSIALKTVTAKRLSNGSDATSEVIEGTLTASPEILVGVKGGVKGECYRIMIRIVTANTFQYQQDILMFVN